MAWGRKKGMQKKRETKNQDRHRRSEDKKQAIREQPNGDKQGKGDGNDDDRSES